MTEDKNQVAQVDADHAKEEDQAKQEERLLKEKLRTWILNANKKLTPSELDFKTALIENRLISSLQVMDMILFLEQLKDGAINVENLKPGAFANIDTIYERFLRDTKDQNE